MRKRPVLALAIAVALVAGCSGTPPEATPDVTFDQPLAVPPLAESRVEDGTRVFRLTAQEGSAELVPGVRSETWGFNGSYLGPTLRAERGEKVAVEVTNDLERTTTVHWHGMHLPAEMDGGPHQMVEPGGTWRPTWTIDQPAATLWYHPHPHGETEEHVYRGLAGLFIIDDGEDVAAGLPHEYGVDDVPVVVQDKRIAEDGSLVFDDSGNEIGTLGRTLLANGTAGAVHEVSTERVRLRLLNGSTARTYDFVLDDGRDVQLVGTDGGLLAAPVATDHVRLSPGERAEIVVTMEPGTQTMLRSTSPDLGNVVAARAFGGTDEFDVLLLRAADRLVPSPEVAPTLTRLPAVSDADADVTRSFVLEDRSINGRTMDMDRIDETVTVGATEVWEVTSRNPFPHNFHVHDVQFRVLSVDGAPPPPELAGRKDTIYLEPRRQYRLLLTFEDFTDPDVPYMFHCHLLLHEDEGMMGQFVVVEPGDQAGRPPSAGHSH
ncbi:MAG TPA: multicopper oxidase domain-containing protein [Phototrophicaceae bacterium]|nr:multicopper oxidase domain-containing protein [Phototrophicaceae bacterium]